MSYEDSEYHRRRAEIELECAASASDQGSAMAHLELDRLHRARRQLITTQRRSECGKALVFSTDKEA